VDEDALVDALLAVDKANAGLPIPQFEITTAAAFRLFAETPADFTLLEVGLGGRYDATNVVTRPLIAAITSISMDHEKFLGNSLAGIAAEKAGIIKRGRPVVVAPQVPEVSEVIDREAERMRAPLLAANRDWVARGEHGRLVFEDAGGLLDLPPPRLPGRHQFVNAGTAIASLRGAGIAIDVKAIERGLATVDWPARLQRLTGGALLARIPRGAELWVDGGHNPGAGVVIAEAMADFEDRSSRPLVLVAGMLNTKDPIGFFAPFAGLAERVLTVPVPGSEASRDAEELAQAAASAGLDAEPALGFQDALDRIKAETDEGPAPRILIVGSLYLAGAVLAANGTPPASQVRLPA
jgi:dihydrofolate synthase/folylpolyglutamate synthase